MLEALRRHPLPMRTRFGHSLVLTYAVPPSLARRALPPGLQPDVYRDPGGTEHAFVAVGLVSVRGLRPAGVPAALGIDCVLTGYRILARFPTPAGRTMRGLYILHSQTDRRLLAAGGNLLTRYHYRLARIALRSGPDHLEATVDSRDGRADLTVTARLGDPPDTPPPGSPFADLAAARRFAGPLPYTFDFETATHSIVVVKAERTAWQPQPVELEVPRLTFWRHGPFAAAEPVLANAFHVADLDYGWQRGSRRTLEGAAR
ncbi:DUF2071 domain-containing protein [Dactylosporangium sp. NPDC051541]|uniref:DUF2071 domain-containing protein n=1 Tax=Dactylosporangium sp. NPDC051541 TaxID=3363977 RepID=UPI00378A7E12